MIDGFDLMRPELRRTECVSNGGTQWLGEFAISGSSSRDSFDMYEPWVRAERFDELIKSDGGRFAFGICLGRDLRLRFGRIRSDGFGFGAGTTRHRSRWYGEGETTHLSGR